MGRGDVEASSLARGRPPRSVVVTIGAVALCVGWLAPARASAQARPTRATFEGAVASRAASRTEGRSCSEDEDPLPSRAIPREDRMTLLGRVLTLPERGGQSRALGVVRVATGDVDANDDLAFMVFVVILERAGSSWRPASTTEIPLAYASYMYEERNLRIARLEDVDEQELLVVLETQTEVQCGSGYCSQRRTVVVDVEERGAPVTANVETGLECQASTGQQIEGGTSFRDVNGDGHRDLVLRRRICEPDYDDPSSSGEPACRAEEVRHVWTARSDEYSPPAAVRPRP